MYSDTGPFTNTMAQDTRPHVTMMRAIQRRAPTFCRRRLLGTSSST